MGNGAAGPADWLPDLDARGWRIEQVATANGPIWATGTEGGVDYPDAGLSLMAKIENVSPWYRERSTAVASTLKRAGLPEELVEVGAGNGGVASHLRDLGVNAVAVEPMPGGARVAAGRGVPTVCGKLEELQLPDGSLQSAAVLDVIEHLADPGPLLEEIARVLSPGGLLVVTVPAMPVLWSSADELAGHFRRYSRPRLIAELEARGFSVGSCRYLFASLIPAVGIVRALPYRLGRRRSNEAESDVGTRQVAGYGSLARRAAELTFALERKVRGIVELPFGTSLVAIARR